MVFKCEGLTNFMVDPDQFESSRIVQFLIIQIMNEVMHVVLEKEMANKLNWSGLMAEAMDKTKVY